LNKAAAVEILQPNLTPTNTSGSDNPAGGVQTLTSAGLASWPAVSGTT